MFFRVYPLDGKGRYLLPAELDCASDEEAVSSAAGMGERVRAGFEVWQLGRFVGRFRLRGGRNGGARSRRAARDASDLTLAAYLAAPGTAPYGES